MSRRQVRLRGLRASRLATPLMDGNGINVNMTPSHPGDFINVTKAAGILGVRRATLSALLNGNAALSAEMALRIEKAFDVSMDMLLGMQAWWDASRMRAHAGEIDVRRYEPSTADRWRQSGRIRRTA